MDPKDSYPADFESEYGTHDPSRELVRNARRVVVKVGLLIIVIHLQLLLRLCTHCCKWRISSTAQKLAFIVLVMHCHVDHHCTDGGVHF